MKGTYLGEFEEVVLLIVGVMKGEAYGVNVKLRMIQQLERNVTLSAVHSALHRLEKKGFVKSKMGESTGKRGGKRKRLFELTSLGVKALEEAKRVRDALWTELDLAEI